MSGRGLPLIRRPVTPLDPSLTTRPVPHERTFTGRSFGPGAAADIHKTARPLKEIDPEAVLESCHPARYSHYENVAIDNTTRNLLKVVERKENMRSDDGRVFLERDPTWGFYVFVTDYSTEVSENIPRAMETLMGVVQRKLRYWTCLPYAEEAFRRFKLDLVEDQVALEGASYDRIRAEFRALIQAKTRDLKSSSEEWDGKEEFDLWPWVRYLACLVLDGAAVSMLANPPLLENLEEHDRFLIDKVVLKVVDRFWQRPPPIVLTAEEYRGVVDCSIGRLPLLYHELTSDSGTGAVETFYEHQRLGLW
ncbi:hypothetical protein PMG11_00822 [Penicillium brasilianum]|uniref:Uncharacterized protein n=1 Tax=Penicillium brasilianum TaxID=104259 RepID=A0A0F7THP7_PENBI|nr:hypothetical protein PMG11_00822 [Penicillium brasilianum]